MVAKNVESYWDVYERTVRKTLKEIDCLLKTAEGEIDRGDAGRLLALTDKQMQTAMDEAGLTRIDKAGFLKIMAVGESEICGFYRRELECGSPYIYTRENIAYIYNLDPAAVKEACDALRIREATEVMLPRIFSNIPARVSN